MKSLKQILRTAICLAMLSGTAAAATFNVDTTIDEPDFNPGDGICSWIDTGGIVINPNNCTLRAAIMEANALLGQQHQIVLEPGATYNIEIAPAFGNDEANGDFDVRWPIHLYTPDGEPRALIRGQSLDRIFEIRAPGYFETLFENVVLESGSAQSNIFPDLGAVGGGIYVGEDFAEPGVQLTLDNVNVQFNFAFRGGAIYNASSGPVEIVDSLIRGNGANEDASAIYNDGSMTLRRTSVLSSYFSPAPLLNGAAIANHGDFLGVYDSIIGTSDATGIFAFSGQVSLRQSTVARNEFWGLISGGASTQLEMTHSLVVDNTIACAESDNGTILAASSSVTDQPDSCANAQVISDVYLYGGSGTQVSHYQLQPFSAAIDATGDQHCAPPSSPVDILGNPRVLDGNGDGVAECDAGALEYAGEPDDGVRTIGPGPSCLYVDFEGAAAALTPEKPLIWRAMAGEYVDQAITLDDVDLVIEGGYDSCAHNAEVVGASVLNGGLAPVFTIGQGSNTGPDRRVTLANLVMQDAQTTGVVIVGFGQNVEVEMRDSVVRSNVGSDGGAFRIAGAGANLMLIDSIVGGDNPEDGNSSADGGGFFCYRGQLTLASSDGGGNIIANNSANLRGGAIYASDECQVTVTGKLSMRENSADVSGGAIFAVDGGAHVSLAGQQGNIVVENNVSNESSAAIVAVENAEIQLVGVAARAGTQGGLLAADDDGIIRVVGEKGASRAQLIGAPETDLPLIRVGQESQVELDRVVVDLGPSQPLAVIDDSFGDFDLTSSVVHAGAAGERESIVEATGGNASVRVLLSTMIDLGLAEDAPIFNLVPGTDLDLRGSIVWDDEAQITSGDGTVTGTCNNLSDDADGLPQTLVSAPQFAPSIGGTAPYRPAENSMLIDRCGGQPLGLELGDVTDLDGRARPVDVTQVVDQRGPYDIGAYEADFGSAPEDELFSNGFE